MKQMKVIPQKAPQTELQIMETSMYAVFQTLVQEFNEEMAKPKSERDIDLITKLSEAMSKATESMTVARQQDMNEEINAGMMQKMQISAATKMPIGFMAEDWAERYEAVSNFKEQFKKAQQAAQEQLQQQFQGSSPKTPEKDVMDTSKNKKTSSGILLPTEGQKNKFTKKPTR